MSGTQKLVKGVSSQTIVTIVLGVVEIVTFSIMSRLLTQKDFGYYAAIVAVAAVFRSLSETGIGSALIQKKDLDRGYINNAFSLCLIFGFVISGALCILSPWLANLVADETMTVPLRLFSTTLLCNCLASINISLMQRQLQFIRIGLIELTAQIITTAVAVLLALKGLGYYAILAKAVLRSFIVLVVSYFACNIRYSFVFDKKEYKSIFNFGGWLMFSSVFRNLANQTDRLLISSLISVEALGVYTRPKEFIYTISEKINAIFDSVLFPILSTYQDDKTKLQSSFLSSFYYLNILGMLVSLLFFCNSEFIIRIFFGQEWLNIDLLFMVLSFYSVLLINGRIGDIFLRSLALTKQQFLFRVCQFVLAIIFIFGGYGLGLVAIAVSIMVSYTIITAIKLIYLAKKLELCMAEIILTMLKSYKFILYVIPFYLLCNYYLPHTLLGGIIQASVIVLIIGILFLGVPQLVGKIYKEDIHAKVLAFVKSKL